MPMLTPTLALSPSKVNGARSISIIARATSLDGLDRIQSRQDSRELVPTEPAEERFARGAGCIFQKPVQPFGHLPQQRVARLVAEGVVDGFEAVEVEEHQGAAPRCAAIRAGASRLSFSRLGSRLTVS